MRSILLSLLLCALGCVRTNPDFVSTGGGSPSASAPGQNGSAGTQPIPGPSAPDFGRLQDGGQDAGQASVDLASSGTPHDFASVHDFSSGNTAKDFSSPHDFASTDAAGGQPGVSCGADQCMDPQFCCATFGSLVCTSPGIAACAAGKKLRCDGPEDCGGGKLCCVSIEGSTCKDSCATAATLCHSVADCGAAGSCCPTQAGYATCSNQPC